MRSYIFTAKERALIRRALKKQAARRNTALRVILFRVRHFKELASDVELYIRLRRLAESEGAVST